MSESSNEPKKKSFFRKPLGCILTLFMGGLLFLVLAGIFGIWFAGSSHALNIASDFVNKQSGFTLKFAENDSNFFGGRLHWKGVEFDNSSRFTDKRFVKLNEVKGVIEIGSLTSDTIVIPEVTVDVGHIAVVGSDDYRNDNNIFDLKKAFLGEAKPEGEKPVEPTKPEGEKPADAPKPAQEGPKKHFRIGKLILRLDRVAVMSHATTPGEKPKAIVDDSAGLNWEFTDVSDENIEKKVYAVVQRDVLGLGKFAAVAGLNLVSAEASKYANDLAKGASDAIKSGTDTATKAVDDAAKGVTDAIGGLFGGDKKKEEEKK